MRWPMLALIVTARMYKYGTVVDKIYKNRYRLEQRRRPLCDHPTRSSRRT